MLEIPLLKDLIDKFAKPQTIHDSIDYLNYFVTAGLLTLFALCTSGKQFFGEPMQCWVPAEFTSGWEKYTENYCFIQNTYYVPFKHQQIPSERSNQISYYRWVPIVLAIQAVCFILPNVLWNMLIKKTSFDPKLIIAEAQKLHNVDFTNRKEEICHLADFIEDSLHCLANRRSNEFFGLHKWLTVLLYLLIKVLYLVNVITQFLLLDKFLGNSNLFWGFELISNMVHGRDWETSSLFPRVVLCDFQVREMANIQQHTVQCVIGMNMINEKIYLILWCWFLLVALCTAINLSSYAANFFIAPLRHDLVLDYLPHSERAAHLKDYLLRFSQHLGADGALLILFISNHAGARVARDVVRQLYIDYAIGFLTRRNFGGHENSCREHTITMSEKSNSASNVVEKNIYSDSPVPKLIENGHLYSSAAAKSENDSEIQSSTVQQMMRRAESYTNGIAESSACKMQSKNKCTVAGKLILVPRYYFDKTD